MICSYCGSQNNQYAENCGFCDAPLKKQRPQKKEYIYLEQCELPFAQLSIFHTFDLLVLLRFVREERTKCYKLMRTVQKAPEGVVIDSDTLAFAESEYRRYTARMKVVEGILIDRMGYKPQRVDNQLLERLKAKMEK